MQSGVHVYSLEVERMSVTKGTSYEHRSRSQRSFLYWMYRRFGPQYAVNANTHPMYVHPRGRSAQ